MKPSFLPRFSLLLCLLLGSIFALAQSPVVSWKKCYGGSARDARALIFNTPDSGFIMVGFGNSTDGDFAGSVNSGNDDIQVLKINACGDVQWRRQFGGTRFEQVFAVTPSPDGGFLITGNTTSPDLINYHGGVADALACKIDSNGNLQWIKAFGGSGVEDLRKAYYFPDSSCLIVGTTDSPDGDGGGPANDLQGWLLRLDKNGGILWKKTIGSAAPENLSDITPTPDGNFLVCGRSARNGTAFKYDTWLVKMDPVGNIIWEKTYGGSEDEIAFHIKLVPSGGFIMAGHGASPELPGHHGSIDGFIMRIDDNGVVVWQKMVGGSVGEQLLGMTVLPNSSFVFAGGSNSSDGDITQPNRTQIDAYAFSLDDNGQLLWSQTFGGSMIDLFYGVVLAPDNSFMFSGFSNSSNGDITGNHGLSDFILFKLRIITRISTDTTSCTPINFQNHFITRDTAWSDTLRDRCGHDSAIYSYAAHIPSAPFVRTIADVNINPGESVVLTTTASGPVNWIGTGLSCFDCLSPVAQPLSSTEYIVKTSIGNCEAADTVLVSVSWPDTLYVPTAFTPNGDGRNDKFMATGSANDYSLKIFNRWGEQIFQSKSLQQGWDGTIQGKAQPSGVYVYWMQYKTMAGGVRKRKGSLVLIR
ncbi:MAG: gliding motility-associated C-terminal domain-containing protein [Chitinophagaceae bacterium]|nr:gliding motility-associated C-terminal domain-containing protein [Chitinophagaceae bacterium]